MAALSASRLVWSETWLTVLVTSPMLAACWLSCSMMATEPAWRSPLCLMLPAQAPIWFEVSSSSACKRFRARRRTASARSRACTRVAAVLVATDKRLLRGAGGLLGAAGDLLHRAAQLLGGRGRLGEPLASSSVAAAMRSSIFCWRPAAALRAGTACAAWARAGRSRKRRGRRVAPRRACAGGAARRSSSGISAHGSQCAPPARKRPAAASTLAPPAARASATGLGVRTCDRSCRRARRHVDFLRIGRTCSNSRGRRAFGHSDGHPPFASFRSANHPMFVNRHKRQMVPIFPGDGRFRTAGGRKAPRTGPAPAREP